MCKDREDDEVPVNEGEEVADEENRKRKLRERERLVNEALEREG
jgi:hypothetical protein